MAGFVALFCDDYGNAGLDDSGFFAGDFAQRVTEKIFVIEVDAGDDAHLRDNDDRGVQPSAEAGFANRESHAHFSEIYKRTPGDALTKSGQRPYSAVIPQSFVAALN